MATTLQKHLTGRPVERIIPNMSIISEQVSEWFWFLLSFVLFVALGPFSGPIALIALFKLGLEDSDHPEPEKLSS